MTAIKIRLEWYEFVGATHVGMHRFAVGCERNLNAATTYQRTWMKRLEEEIIGATGERAFCKALGIYWDGSVNTFHRAPDTGDTWEIRTTTHIDGCLIVRDNDSAARNYALVIAQPPWYKICGWISGDEARKDEWVRNPHGHRRSWFVPQHALTSMEMVS